MFVSFTPMISNNRQQKTNFKALPIDKIIKNIAEADMFSSAALREGLYDGKRILKTDENVKDLQLAYENAVNPATKPAIRLYSRRVAEKWGIEIEPKK